MQVSIGFPSMEPLQHSGVWLSEDRREVIHFAFPDTLCSSRVDQELVEEGVIRGHPVHHLLLHLAEL